MLDHLDFTPGWDLSTTILAVCFGIVAAMLESRRSFHGNTKTCRCRARRGRAAGAFWLPARGPARHRGA